MLDLIGLDCPKKSKKSIKWIIVDSAIIAGIAFISSLPEAKLPNIYDLYIAVKAFIYAFLLQLAIERGLKKVRK